MPRPLGALASSPHPPVHRPPIVNPDFRHAQAPTRTAGQPVVYQQYTPLGSVDGVHPVWGTWVVRGRAAGLGIRESDGPVTDASARFVPHFMDAARSTPEQIAEWLRE